MSKPTLEDDTFVDKALAQVTVGLVINHKGEMTNGVELLVRPTDIRSDETGGHPGEKFVLVSVTREELREMLGWLDEDWELHQKHTEKQDEIEATGQTFDELVSI